MKKALILFSLLLLLIYPFRWGKISEQKIDEEFQIVFTKDNWTGQSWANVQSENWKIVIPLEQGFKFKDSKAVKKEIFERNYTHTVYIANAKYNEGFATGIWVTLTILSIILNLIFLFNKCKVRRKSMAN